MPNLQIHMLRVSALAKIIAENSKKEINYDLLLRTALLHDMGNIVKFPLDDGDQDKYRYGGEIEEWRRVKSGFISKYGKTAHIATCNICRELGQDDVVEILELEYQFFNSSPASLFKADIEVQIYHYTDFRVIPKGVSTLEERIKDLVERYSVTQEMFEVTRKIEKIINDQTKIDITKIKESNIEPYFDELLAYKI